MSRMKLWLLQRFLPAWAKETLFEENARLVNALRQEREKNKTLSAYMRGMETALRHTRAVQIITRGEDALGCNQQGTV